MTTPPPQAVLSAFGGGSPPTPLAGGQGTTWQAGELVLKPAGDPRETAWRSGVLERLDESADFRLASPVRSLGGDWIVAGWEASRAVPGKEDHSRPDDVLRTAAAFHAALAGLDRPGFLDTRDDPWTQGERMAWDETAVTGSDRALALLEPLAAMRQPVALPSQPVHGDLLGNVLFADGLPPAVIDWAVYFRPVAWASAVAVCDAVSWYAAPASLVDRWSHLPAWKQLLIRALIYRIATDDLLSGDAGPSDVAIEGHLRMVSLVTAMP